jgi:hypothetical protein
MEHICLRINWQLHQTNSESVRASPRLHDQEGLQVKYNGILFCCENAG